MMNCVPKPSPARWRSMRVASARIFFDVESTSASTTLFSSSPIRSMSVLRTWPTAMPSAHGVRNAPRLTSSAFVMTLSTSAPTALPCEVPSTVWMSRPPCVESSKIFCNGLLRCTRSK
jgi:hypothetical protein